MGFGHSGSLLVIFIALFIALGSVYTVTSNVGGELVEAQEEQVGHHHAVQETSLNITEASWADGELTIAVTNTGSTDLSVSDTTLLLDGEYVPLAALETVTVDGVSETDNWDANTQLRLVDERDRPDRVKLVTENRVAVSAEVAS